MYKSYRPGDIVLAKVMSLGDSQSYLLTTAENELGVVIATSEEGMGSFTTAFPFLRPSLNLPSCPVVYLPRGDVQFCPLISEKSA